MSTATHTAATVSLSLLRVCAILLLLTTSIAWLSVPFFTWTVYPAIVLTLLSVAFLLVGSKIESWLKVLKNS